MDALVLDVDEIAAARRAYAATCQTLSDESVLAATLRARAESEPAHLRPRTLREAAEAEHAARWAAYELDLLDPATGFLRDDAETVRPEVYARYFPAEPTRDEPGDAAWHATAEYDAARVLLDSIRADAVQTNAEPLTLRDVYATHHHGPCRRGRKTGRGTKRSGAIKVGGSTCRQWSCPAASCSPAKFLRPIATALAAWNGVPIYRHVFATDDDWRNSMRGRRLAAIHAGRFARIPSTGGAHVVFTPGPGPGGEEGELVEHPGLALAEALLSAPAMGAQKRVWTPKIERDVDESVGRAQDGSWFAGPLPFSTPLAVVIRAVEQAVGAVGEFDWKIVHDEHGTPITFEVYGLNPDDYTKAQSALEPIFAEARAERKNYHAVAHRFDALLTVAALGGSCTPEEFKNSAGVSMSTARNRLHDLHTDGLLERKREGRGHRYADPAILAYNREHEEYARDSCHE